jgi:hypothetical protein
MDYTRSVIASYPRRDSTIWLKPCHQIAMKRRALPETSLYSPRSFRERGMAIRKFISMVLLGVALLAAAFGQPLGKGRISGSVLEGEIGEAVRKAVVTLTLQGTPRRWATTRTDSAGHFQFEGLPAGKYDLRAAKGTEGTAINGANSVRELGTLINLGDGETLAGLKLRFLRAASVSGQVCDADGEPLADVPVNLLRRARNLGVPALANYLTAITNERGEYHITGVDPGQYILQTSAGARMGDLYFGDGATPGQQKIRMSQYYRGAHEARDASLLHVRGGESLAGLDFVLGEEPAIQIHGRVTGVPAEPPIPESQPRDNDPLVPLTAVQIQISPADVGTGRWASGTGAPGPEYRFQLPDLAAGRYRIDATYSQGDKTYAASQVFDLNQGTGEILLALAPAHSIQGTLRVEGQVSQEEQQALINAAPAGQRPNLQAPLSVHLRRPNASLGGLSARVAPGGKFSFEQVPAGDWWLEVTPVPPGFLKSARYGDQDVRFTTFHAGSGSETPLQIIISMRTATVQGQIDGESPESKRAGVVLAAVGPFHDLTRFYYGGVADDEGKFRLTGIAPGKYRIFAVEKMAAAAFRTPEVADQLAEYAEVIEVSEGAVLEARPRLVPEERALKAVQ